MKTLTQVGIVCCALPALLLFSGPSLWAFELPKFYGLYAIDNDKLVELAETKEPRFSPSVQFLFFEKMVAMAAADTSLLRIAYVRYRITVAGRGTDPHQGRIQKVTAMNFWDTSGQSLSAFGEGARTRAEVKVRAGPVAGQPEMIRIVPSAPLSPGVYMLVIHGQKWVFGVQHDKIKKADVCTDEYLAELSFVQLPNYKPCETYDALPKPPPAEPPRGGPRPGQPTQPSAPVEGDRPSQQTGKPTLASLARDIPDSVHFRDAHRVFAADFDTAWTAATRVLEGSGLSKILGGDKVRTSDRQQGILITEPTLHVRLLGPSLRRQYVILIEKEGEESTRLSVKGLCYNVRGTTVIGRWPPERCSDAFLEEVGKELAQMPRSQAGTKPAEPARPAVACADLLDKGYVLVASGTSYKVLAVPPGTIKEGRVFLDSTGRAPRDSNLAAALSEAAWVYEKIIADPSARQGKQRVLAHLETNAAVRRYEVAQDVLARASVHVLAATLSGGASTTALATLTWSVVRDQFLSLRSLLALEARLGLDLAAARYEEIEAILSNEQSGRLDVATARKVRALYAQAHGLELSYAPLLASLNPKTGRELVEQALTSVGREALNLLPTNLDNVVTARELWDLRGKLNELLAVKPGFSSYAEGFALAVRLDSSTRDVIEKWSAVASRGCHTASSK